MQVADSTDASDDGVSEISAVRLRRGKDDYSPPLAYSVQNRSGACSNLYRAIGRFKIVVSNSDYTQNSRKIRSTLCADSKY